jgi:hypothetical protein
MRMNYCVSTRFESFLIFARWHRHSREWAFGHDFSKSITPDVFKGLFTRKAVGRVRAAEQKNNSSTRALIHTNTLTPAQTPRARARVSARSSSSRSALSAMPSASTPARTPQISSARAAAERNTHVRPSTASLGPVRTRAPQHPPQRRVQAVPRSPARARRAARTARRRAHASRRAPRGRMRRRRGPARGRRRRAAPRAARALAADAANGQAARSRWRATTHLATIAKPGGSERARTSGFRWVGPAPTARPEPAPPEDDGHGDD